MAATYFAHLLMSHHIEPQVAVVMVPLPLQGHLNQFLQLSRVIASYNIPIHYISSTTHNRQAKVRVHGWNPQSYDNINFHDLKFPCFRTPPPNPNSLIKFPAHLQPVIDASKHLQQPIFQLLQVLSCKYRRIVIIHDSLMASVVQDVQSFSNAESYSFHTVSAFSLFYYVWESVGRPELDGSESFPKHVPSNEGCLTPEFTEYVAAQHKWSHLNSGKLYNTCRAIEDKYLNLLAKLPLNADKKLFAVGPLNPIAINNNKSTKCRDTCLKWLDGQEVESVLYVSFGTTTTMCDEQIKELAVGLQRSEQKFLWVLRDADIADVFAKNDVRRAELPKGFEEMVKDRGLVVRDWAPQLEILGHPSIGGFMSHCGWNSCMESITMGVPIAAWPMHSDQPKNAVLVTDELKVGLIVKDWARRHEVVKSITIENAVRKLMTSKEGHAMRKKAAGLGASVRGLVEKGGSAHFEMDKFIAHITR